MTDSQHNIDNNFAERLQPELSTVLKKFNFEPVEQHEVVALWQWKTRSINRAVALVSFDANSGSLKQQVSQWREQISQRVGYTWFFYSLGIQLIILWPNQQAADIRVQPEKLVAQFDRQSSLIQSVFIIDQATGRVAYARAWGQTITRPVQDALLKVCRDVAAEITPIHTESQKHPCERCGGFTVGFLAMCDTCYDRESQFHTGPSKKKLTTFRIIALTLSIVFISIGICLLLTLVLFAL